MFTEITYTNMPRKEPFRLSPDRNNELRAQFSAPEDNYNILRGDTQAIREQSGVWDTDYVLTKYAAETDKMIANLDGSTHSRSVYLPGATPEDKERANQTPDSVVWLDKSARPVSWMVDALWDQFADDRADKPNYEFLNIDRADWFGRQGHSQLASEQRLGANDFDIDKVPEEDILRIRAIFTDGKIDPDNWQESVTTLPTRLDGQNVLIIDEVKNKGGTLSIATQLLSRAIPEATFSGDYFWSRGSYAPDVSRPDELQMESAPVWYDSTSPYGRGVGDISQTYYESLPDTPDNLPRKLGWIALSAPLLDVNGAPTLDKKSKQLQQDIAYLSYDIAQGSVLRTPSPDRDIDDYDHIVSDQGLTIPELTAYRSNRDRQNPTK